jgi:hypothetical protein
MNQFWTTVTMTLCVICVLLAALVLMGLGRPDRPGRNLEISPRTHSSTK